MNTLTFTQRNISARLVAIMTVLSMVLSAFPVAFFVAEAAESLYGPVDVNVTSVGGEHVSGPIDASNHVSLVLSFDYDSTLLDSTNGDSFTYGWRSSGGDNDIETIVGLASADPAEIDSVSYNLPAGAQVSDLEVYIYVTADPGTETDEVKITNLLVEGEEVIQRILAPKETCDDQIQNQNETGIDEGGVCAPPQKPMPPRCDNLLINGSFEDDEVTNGSKWQKFGSVTGWLVEKVSDNSATTLELMENWSGNDAADGDQYAELDGDHSTKVTQTVATIPGATYELRWAFAPRHGISANQNQLSVMIDGLEVDTEGPATGSSGLEVSDWTRGMYQFTADDSTDVTFADIGPSNSFGTFLDDAQLCLVKKPRPVVNLHTTKIVCTDEADLPNGQVDSPITADTATDWVNDPENSSCEIVEGWEFEYAPKGTSDPGDVLVGTAGGDWTTFTGSTLVPASVFVGTDYFWMREVLQSDYIPFTHGPEGNQNTDDYTAEFYCHTDVKNFDNFDRVDNPQVGEDYYCVGWNVPKEPQECTLTLVSDTDDYVVEKDDDAKELSFIHSAWTAIIDGATWVWGDDPVTNPENDETQTFNKQFGWAGTVDSATLYVASDNSHRAEINGVLAGEATEEQNFRITDQDEYDVTGLIGQGNNDISIAVKNWAGNSNPQSNPAGLLYKLVVTTYDDVDCNPPYEPDPEASLIITDPASDGQILSGEHTFKAEYVDDDETVDHINWAIRYETCAANTNTVAGNVDGFSDSWSFVGIDFMTTLDMSSWDSGEYCLVVNPNEGPGQDDLRESRTFILENPPEYGPYCGDGEINQLWEQCDGIDTPDGESCTDYCTLDNQCSAEQLIKITLDENAPDSQSFDNTLHLGGAGNMIPNGTWFNFNELGDSTAQSIANSVDGLAIERTATELRIAVDGGDQQRPVDYAYGTVMTKGIVLGNVNKSAVPGWKLEDGGGVYSDTFVTNSDEGAEFEFHTGPAQDMVAVEILQGEEYDCDECKAEVEARVVIRDESGAEVINGGLGNLTETVILGDGTTVPFGEWFKVSEAPNPGESAVWIDDAETVSNFSNPETKEGLFVSREGNGEVKVALYGYHNPGGDVNYESLRATIEFNDGKVLGGSTDDLPGDFKLENHSESDGVNSNDNFDSFEESNDLMSVHFDFWVDTKADAIVITLDSDETATCDDDTDPRDPEEPDTYRIDGYKHELGDDYVAFLSGWNIILKNVSGTEIMSTTTDENGYYYFIVETGDYQVHETMQSDWYQAEVREDGQLVDTDADVEYCSITTPDESDYDCDFYNTYDPGDNPQDPILGCTDKDAENYNPSATSGNLEAESCTYSSGSSSSGGRPRTPERAPMVAGASTVSQCPFLVDYMQIGVENDRLEVMKLQLFLNMFKDLFGGSTNPITGFFGPTTDSNVKALQEYYRSEILDPWFTRGIVPHSRPTGFVYKTTLWKINDIVCPDHAVLPVFEGEDLNSNIDLGLKAHVD